MPDVQNNPTQADIVCANPYVVAVIPAHNEARFIGSVVIEALSYVDVVIVVDDGSTDKTSFIAEQAGARVVQTRTNLGKAKALELGFKQARSFDPSVIVMLDGDGQHSPHEIPNVIQPVLESNTDMVIGSRFKGTKVQVPWWRQIGQHALTFLTNLTAGTTSTDSQSGFRAFLPSSLESFNIRTSGFSIESEMQFWATDQRLSVSEIPINCLYEEKSKRNPIGHGVQVLNGIFRLVVERRPLFYLGVLGTLLTVLGIAGWWWTISIYHQVSQLPLGYALLSTLITIIGFVFIFQGITLNELRKILAKQQPFPNGDTWELKQLEKANEKAAKSARTLRPEYTNGVQH